MHWFATFVWTLVIELPVYELGGKSLPLPWWHMPVVTLGLNILTHPAFSWWVFALRPSVTGILVAEVMIAVVEGGVLFTLRRDLGPLKALSLALFANGASFGFGILVEFVVTRF